ncbi:Mycobacterium numidiamassiliense ORFan [Mycobacterium numidiamassiliense]|uniref:Mycobacterium numidiamassiliense ORFan n=1 Tax=Mycobacterium numidiamassiliense TaxID=1841861 RepID=A0A2U3PIM9_9MYCO|nr:hypothetical protein [Mycobacterium numidiamassiliense]SPM43602.1 Mycobacterium numidiamassiliense ORFan [Mycobacterium numidiamassiliense]
MLRLRLSERAIQSSWATIGLVDCDTGRLIEKYARHADAERAMQFLKLVGVARYGTELGGAATHELAAQTCAEFYGHRQYEKLPGQDLEVLHEAVRCSLEEAGKSRRGA